MLKDLQDSKRAQLFIGFFIGVGFGFLLQKGGVTDYDVIIGQLLLQDFTVVKIMLSAVVTGMVGIYVLCGFGLAQLHPKEGSVDSSVIGGLVFGIGFGLLGYCPGTVAGAFAQGWLDALFGGIFGILIGVGLYAGLYPKVENKLVPRGYFGALTIPQLLNVSPWLVIIPVCMAIVGLFYWLEKQGF